MKRLLTLQGGYPRQMDYLLNLQSEFFALGNSLFGALGFDLVLSGCTITDNQNGTVNISAGLVYVSGEAIRFDGANNVPADGSKAFAKGGEIGTDTKTFADGNAKNVYSEAKAIIANVTGSVREIKVKTVLYDLKQYIQDTVQSYEVKGTFKDIYDFDGTFLQNFDSTGLGVTPRWNGWALDNGNNNTPGSAGRSLVGAGTYTDADGEQVIIGIGDKGGKRRHKLTVQELPKFKPKYRATQLGGPTDTRIDNDVIDADNNYGLWLGPWRDGQEIGGDQPHPTVSPYMGVYRVIKIV